MTTAARTFEERASHFYTKDGKAAYESPRADGKGMCKSTVVHARKYGYLPSPTTILKLLARPQLESWKIETACLSVLTSPRKDGESLDDFVYRVLHVDKEQDAERDAAADIGEQIHSAVECALNDVEYDATLRPYVDATLDAIKPFGRCVFTEKILVGDGYAGRTDAGFENDSFITIVDLKGCKKLPKVAYDEHRLQMAAYAGALGNTGDKMIQCANVYINRNVPGEVAVCGVWPWKEEYETFRTLVKLWYQINGVELPSSYK